MIRHAHLKNLRPLPNTLSYDRVKAEYGLHKTPTHTFVDGQSRVWYTHSPTPDDPNTLYATHDTGKVQS